MIALILAVSCTNQMVEALEGEGVLTLSVCQETGKATSLSGTSPDVEDITWTYRLTKNDDGVVTGEVPEETKMSGTSVSKSVSYGSWKAEVWGYRDTPCRELVYLGSGTGTVAKGGGTIAVSAGTTTDAEMARAFSDSDTPKSTADLILRPIAVEGDEGGLVGKKCQWILDGAVIATWTSTGGTWYDDDTGNAIPDSGETLYIAPGTGRSLVLSVRDTDGTLLGAEGWKNTDIALNCTYTVQGTLVPRNGSLTITISVSVLSGTPVYGTAVEPVEISSFFDIDPSSEMPADNAIIIGYRKGVGSGINTSDLSEAITFPCVLACEEEEPVLLTPSVLGLEPIYVTTSEELVASKVENVWFGKTAALGSKQSVNNKIKVKEVRYVSGTTDIQAWSVGSGVTIERIVIPEGVGTIGDNAFFGCASLTSFVFPNTVRTVGDWVFTGCYNLSSVTLSNQTISIGEDAFGACGAMPSILIPESVTFIGRDAFELCNVLSTIYIDKTEGSLDLSNAAVPSGCTVLWKEQF